MSALGTYQTASKRWRFRTLGGYSASKGVGAKGFSFQVGVKNLNFQAKDISNPKAPKYINLNMAVSGVELSLEAGKDILQEITQIGFARTSVEFDYVIPCVNKKNPTEPMSFEFLGPCSLISYDIGKAHLVKDYPNKIASGTYLLVGMNTTIADRSPDWLQKVVDNSTSGTLGGNVYNFNKNNGPFSNARMCIPVDVNDKTIGGKVVAGSVALFSGQITATGTGY